MVNSLVPPLDGEAEIGGTAPGGSHTRSQAVRRYVVSGGVASYRGNGV
jgi:hypothetical protein